MKTIQGRSGTLTLASSTPITGVLGFTDPPSTLTLRSGQDVRMTVSGNPGDWVSVGLSGVSASLAPTTCYSWDVYLTLAILKPDGTTVSSIGLPCGGDRDVQLPVAGMYTVLVQTIQGRSGTLTLTSSTPIWASVALNETPLSISLTRAGQDSRVTFNGVAGQQVTARVTGNTAGCVALTLLNPDGTSLTSGSSCASSFNLATQTLPSTGTYTVDANPGINTGTLTLSVTNP